MKTSTNKKELKELQACSSGYHTFIKAHGESTAKLSQCLESNGWDDVWWLISKSFDQFSDQQKTDLRLLGCEYALSSIDNFEKEFPEDKRPREAIEASIAFAKGEISKEKLEAAGSAAVAATWSTTGSAAGSAARAATCSARSAAESTACSARSAAESAAWSARSAAESAAWSTACSARSAAESAAWSAAESAAIKRNTKMLMGLFIKWESQ